MKVKYKSCFSTDFIGWPQKKAYVLIEAIATRTALFDKLCLNSVFRLAEMSNKYLLLAEFSIRTVNYGPSFFPSIYSMEKNEDPRIHNLQYGPKKRG